METEATTERGGGERQTDKPSYNSPCPQNKIDVRLDGGHGANSPSDQRPGRVAPVVTQGTAVVHIGVARQMRRVVRVVIVKVSHVPEVACQRHETCTHTKRKKN